MRKIAKYATAIATAVGSALVGTVNVSATSYSYDYDYGAGDAFGSMACLGGNLIVTICSCIFSLAITAFNVWMIIDVVQRDEKVLPGKIKWLLVVLLVPFGSVVYYFMRKRPMDKMGKPVKVESAS